MAEDKSIFNRLVESNDPLLKKGYQSVVQRPVLPPPQGGSGIIPDTSTIPQSETVPVNSVHVSEGYQPAVQRPVLSPPQGISGIMPPPVIGQQEVTDTTSSAPIQKE